MTSMSISQSDKDMAREYLGRLTQRRRQLCPWPFSIRQTEALYIPGNILDLRDRMLKESANNEKLLYRYRIQNLNIPKGLLSPALYGNLRINAQEEIWVFNNTTVNVCSSSFYLPEFQKWALHAAKVELENQLFLQSASELFNAASTWKQIHKALPHTLQALRAVVDEVDAGRNSYNRDYTYRLNRDKLVEVQQVLNSEGSRRARVLPEKTRDMLARRTSFLENIAAQAMMLEPSTTIDDGMFQKTWWSSISMERPADDTKTDT